MRNDFVVFILSHGRADRVTTFKTLKDQGYTGKIIFVLDNEDEQLDRYIELYGIENIVIIDKKEIAKRIDTADLSTDRRTILYARNECFKIAKEKGYRYFLQLDDDYYYFRYRYENDNQLKTKVAKDLDKTFSYMIDFLNDSKALTVAFAQAGDFIGGKGSSLWRKKTKRKAMNSFFCDVERPFKFIGRINEDVNTYTLLGNRGELFITVADVQLAQKPTQQNKGGMTDIYKEKGTYLKSFYSVMISPQCVKIADMGYVNRRIHHRIKWDNCCSKILNEKWKKSI